MNISLAPIVIVLLVAVIVVTICRRFNVPSMLGYLLVGFLAGPSVLHLIPKTAATDYLGEIGIVFLMFSIGLEFSLAKLKAMRRLVFGLGGMQVLLTISAILAILMVQGTPFKWAFAVAGALTMSSTAIVSRILSEKTELGQPHGQMGMGVLLMQDIAVVPLMILLPALASGANGEDLTIALGLAAFKMALTLSLLFFVGSRVMTPWFRMVAKRKSSELFMINVLLVTLGVAYITELEGLSLALGAFVAGMLLSETEYRFQVEDDIRPFRDILLGFFFIAFYMKNPIADCMKTSMYLAQGGEFGFVILAIASKINMVSIDIEQAATAAILLSMVLAPFLLNSSDKIVNRLVKSTWDMKAVDLQNMLIATMNKSEHVLIVGYGRGGQAIGRTLSQEDIPYYALDLDAERVQIARSAGEPVSFGDAKRREVLAAAGLGRAKMVVITLSNMPETQHVLDNITRLYPSMPVYVRATSDDYLQTFTDMGAEETVSDSKETSLALASYAMLGFGRSYQHVHQVIMNIRRSRYKMLAGLFDGRDDEASFYHEHNSINRHAFDLPESAYAVGKKVSDLPLSHLDVQLLFIRRHTHRIESFDDDLIFEVGDILVIAGKKDKIISLENWSLQGGS